jgi:uncharacterized protein YecE (DUF72 family)
VLADNPGQWPIIDETTSDLNYVRLHGHEELYASGYSDEELDAWAAKIAGLAGRRPGRLHLLRQRHQGQGPLRRDGSVRRLGLDGDHE